MIDEQMKINDAELIKHEQERNEALKEVSNHLHESCIISNDEVHRGLIVRKKNDSRTLMFCLVDAVRMMVLDPTIPVKINAMT